MEKKNVESFIEGMDWAHEGERMWQSGVRKEVKRSNGSKEMERGRGERRVEWRIR